MFTLEALPASQGDALWLTWGDEDAPHHLLVDAGPPRNALRRALRSRIAERVTATDGRIELLVVTHIDSDHVGGVLHLFADGLPCEIGDVWFNGYDHHPTDLLGAKQAERLSDLLVEHGLAWNAAFGAGPVAVPADPAAPLPTTVLPGGLRLTVLGPTRQRLRELAPHWREECEKAACRFIRCAPTSTMPKPRRSPPTASSASRSGSSRARFSGTTRWRRTG